MNADLEMNQLLKYFMKIHRTFSQHSVYYCTLQRVQPQWQSIDMHYQSKSINKCCASNIRSKKSNGHLLKIVK